MKVLWKSLIITLIGIVLGSIATPQPAHSQNEDRLNIVATNTIIADVVSNVAGDSGYVVSLMGPGEDPHNFNLSARDIVTLEDADVIFINGANLEESLLDVLHETAAPKLITISDCVDILPVLDMEPDEDHAHADEDFSTTSATEETCTAYHTELNELVGETPTDSAGLGHLFEVDCAEEACDPHVWLDVQNVMLWTMLVRDNLIALDPVNEATYRENAENYLIQLGELDAEISTIFAQIPMEERVLVTNHDSLSYLAHRYDFEIVGTIIPTASTSAEPSTSDVINVITVIQDTGTSAIFVDNTANSVVADQIAEETGARIQVLYTGSLSPINEPASTYLDYMRYNTTQIVEGLTQ